MIELQHLTKRFATQGGTVVALNDINLTLSLIHISEPTRH